MSTDKIRGTKSEIIFLSELKQFFLFAFFCGNSNHAKIPADYFSFSIWQLNGLRLTYVTCLMGNYNALCGL